MSQNQLLNLAKRIKQSHESKTAFRLPKMSVKDLGKLAKLLAN